MPYVTVADATIGVYDCCSPYDIAVNMISRVAIVAVLGTAVLIFIVVVNVVVNTSLSPWPFLLAITVFVKVFVVFVDTVDLGVVGLAFFVVCKALGDV